jgi:hypothetical protein
MKLLLASFFAVTTTAFAGSVAPVSYHDGTLVSAAAVNNCSANPEQACSDEMEFLVQSEGILYSLTPLSTGERATLGWGKEFSKYSSLDHQPAGTSFKVRDDGKHFFVRVGNRESMYSAIEAHAEDAMR